ncbi:MAG TPA: right-handed parallel beta-helix repeat-containing protein [Thermoanaerobaculia bacterium]|nr:right-handed parallel beta-helix repeat-containing protein [Thermoanaerobaculia bacterium]
MTSRAHDIFFVPGEFRTIQEAVDAVVRPTTIMIEPGLYAESVLVAAVEYLVIESTCLSRRGVVLAGSDGEAVLSVRDSVLHLSGIEVRSNARLRGMIVEDSSVSLQECVVAGNRIGDGIHEAFGAGMLCRRSVVRIQKSTVAGNTVDCPSAASAGGGGLYFEDCRVEIPGSSVQVNAVYARNEARGGGILCERSRLRMWRSRVTDNAIHAATGEGGGMYLKDSIDCQIGGSVITGNGSAAARGGGVFLTGGVANVAIHGNTVVRQNHPDDRVVE